MKMICFGSSSAGNSYYIELQRKGAQPPVKLILEAGLPYKEISAKAAINQINLAEIDGVLVTHGHADHCRSVADFKRRGARVYANQYITAGDPETTLKAGTTKVIALDTTVIPFEVEHDAEEPLGFVISTGVEKILFVNDSKFYKAKMDGLQFDYVMIEANYDGQVLHFALENAKAEHDAKNVYRYERIINSHMSLANCIKHLERLDLTKCKAIFLMHLSDRHAQQFKFKEEVQKATGVQTFVCKKAGGMI